jgi:hypothetical protein
LWTHKNRAILPFDEVAHHRGRVLNRMDPLAAGGAFRCVHCIADHHVHRRPVAPTEPPRRTSMHRANGVRKLVLCRSAATWQGAGV